MTTPSYLWLFDQSQVIEGWNNRFKSRIVLKLWIQKIVMKYVNLDFFVPLIELIILSLNMYKTLMIDQSIYLIYIYINNNNIIFIVTIYYIF